MFENFKRYITAKGDFTAEELEQMHKLAEVKTVRRRQMILQEGEVCRYKIFVAKGLVRTYRLKEDGTEHIMRFAAENGWTIDHESYTNQSPSKFYMEALEDSELIMWTRENANILFDAIPAFRLLSDQLKERSMNESLQRILMNISATAEEKYEEFTTSFPEIFQRVPLHMVASYLGVSRETLSRIRHAQFSRLKKHSIR